MLNFILSYLKINTKAALAYKGSLFSQIIGMLANDFIWLSFWILYFKAFPVLNGWTVDDIFFMWAVVAMAYGLATGFCYNCLLIPRLVVEGQLDQMLILPKPVLLQVWLSKMQVINFGDVLFSFIVLLVFAKMTFLQFCFFVPVVVLVAILFLSVFTSFSSLVFYLRNSDALSSQMSNIFLMLSSYPASIFDRWVKIILFSLFPTAFISTFPVMIIKEQSYIKLGEMFLVVLLYLILSITLFYQGLKRYESGNLISLKR